VDEFHFPKIFPNRALHIRAVRNMTQAATLLSDSAFLVRRTHSDEYSRIKKVIDEVYLLIDLPYFNQLLEEAEKRKE